MKHSCNSLKSTESLDAGTSPDRTGSLTRRRFITLLTASASSLALQACGGGGDAPPVNNVPPAPPVTPTNPVTLAWNTVPTLTFTQGIASSVSVAQWITASNAAALTLSLNSVALPAGVTYNSSRQSFDYDGVGAVASTDGHILTAIGG
jgi:hypothetical protein